MRSRSSRSRRATDSERLVRYPVGASGRTATLGGLVRHLARQVLDMDGPIPAALFAESPHLSDAELDELDAIINAAEDEASDKKGGE
mgnify:CR=1 FL=1